MVQFTDLQGHLEQLNSENDGTVSNVNDPTVGALSIKGNVRQGALLEAVTENLSDLDGIGTFTYQWLVDGQAIGGATNATFLLSSQNDVGKKSNGSCGPHGCVRFHRAHTCVDHQRG